VRARLRHVLGIANTLGEQGLTVVDLREITDLHHGQASSALSTLHRLGQLAMLAERRDRCHVYVVPKYIGERDTVEPRRNKSREHVAALRTYLDQREALGVRYVPIGIIRAIIEDDK
jgi:hypothetical protein